jgi:hypothetical protein
MHKLAFILTHYLELLAFAAAIWSYGAFAAARLLRLNIFGDLGLCHLLAAVTGLGLVITALQLLALAGLLTPPAVLLLVGTGAALAVLRLVRAPRLPRLFSWRAPSPRELVFTVAPALALLVTLLPPFQPPTAWDETIYHLPQAQQWARTGHLAVNDWLRFPWFPLNYELLYAGALSVSDDVFAHLLHALAGWLVFALIWRAGRRWIGAPAALVAAALWLILACGEVANANLNMFADANSDMGVTLFVFAACIVFDAWLDAREPGLLVLFGFLLGVAVGGKYQALAFPLFFGLAALRQERRPGVLAAAAVAFLLPCGYWYLRNMLLAGDPVAPFGAALFGAGDWNAGDFDIQYYELAVRRTLPSPLLWPALLAALSPRWRALPQLRRGLYFSIYALVAWAVSSGYPRYLMPAWPVLALLSAHVVFWGMGAALEDPRFARARRALPALGLAACLAGAAAAIVPVAGAWNRVGDTPAARDRVLAAMLPDYRVLRYLEAHPPGKAYQFGIEYGVYYAPQPIWGDYVGRWRYRDFEKLPPRALHDRLAGLGFATLIVNTHDFPGVAAAPGFGNYFAQTYDDGIVRVYSIKK